MGHWSNRSQRECTGTDTTDMLGYTCKHEERERRGQRERDRERVTGQQIDGDRPVPEDKFGVR